VFDRLREALGRLAKPEASTAELDAALALVVLAMFADRRVVDAETSEVQRWMESRELGGHGAPLADRIPAIMAKVRRGLEQDVSGQTVIDDVDRLVRDPTLRAELPALCRSIIESDRTVGPDEADLLARIEQRFA
jgi:hypothetical protein